MVFKWIHVFQENIVFFWICMYEKNSIYLHIYIFDRTLGTTQLLALIHLHVLQDNLPPFHAMFHFFLQTEQRMSVDLLKNLLLSLLEFLWVRLSRASHCKITCNWNYCWKDSQESLSVISFRVCVNKIIRRFCLWVRLSGVCFLVKCSGIWLDKII